MARVSNILFAIINCMALIMSLVLLYFSVYTRVHGSTDCEKTLQNPLLISGFIVLILALLGLIGCFCKANRFLIIYLSIIFFWIAVITILTVIVFVNANISLGRKQFHVDQANWLQKQLVGDQNWPGFKSCLVEVDVCNRIKKLPQIHASEIFQLKINPIEFGCCMPPAYCGYEYNYGTFWTKPKNGLAKTYRDCKAWGNPSYMLCFDCDECKRGFLTAIGKERGVLAFLTVFAIVVPIIYFTLGCCTKKNNQRDSKYNRGNP